MIEKKKINWHIIKVNILIIAIIFVIILPFILPKDNQKKDDVQKSIDEYYKECLARCTKGLVYCVNFEFNQSSNNYDDRDRDKVWNEMISMGYSPKETNKEEIRTERIYKKEGNITYWSEERKYPLYKKDCFECYCR